MDFRYLVQCALLGLLLQFNGSLGCLERVKIGLLKLKASIQHLNGSALSSWRNEESDCCKWEGVVCNETTKQVIQLFLSGVMVNPSSEKPASMVEEKNSSLTVKGWRLNASLFQPFVDLQVLDLSLNFLTDLNGVLRLNNLQDLYLQQNLLTRVPVLSALPSLKLLDVSQNNLKEFPDSQGLCQLSHIQELDLSQNGITGNLPPCLSNLTSLQALDLSQNGITGNLPPCLSKLTSLRFLELSENNLVGPIPPILNSLQSLEYISLSNNHFNGSFSLNLLANNSKLLVFDFINSNNHLKVYTENPSWFPLFQLKIFRLSNCILNEPTGEFPSFLSYQQDLLVLELSHIKLTGKLPTWLLVQNTGLEILNLSGNNLTGPLEYNSTSKFLNVSWFDVSNNNISGELPSDIGSFLPNLISLNMSRNELQGSIPASLGEMKFLKFLDLSTNNFSGPLPKDLVMECRSMSLLKLSKNKLNGRLPKNSNLPELYYLFLDNNYFTGDISNGFLNSSGLLYLDISRNLLSGNLPSWIGKFPHLNALILSHNLLEGPIPMGLCNLTQLHLLDLSHNKFNQTIPHCACVSKLEILHLQSNELTGSIPNVLNGSSSLFSLDLRNNKLSGEIPEWISLLSNLRFLLLKGNSLSGPIPPQLCKLKNISMLDLSYNHFSGEIPSCLHIANGSESHLYDGLNISSTYSMSSELEIHYNPFFEFVKVTIYFSSSKREEEIEFVSKYRFEQYKGYILNLMTGLDLSCNNLTGSIPPEIGNLSGIHSLNLSRNDLAGSIPETFSKLEQIESLDLSQNRLSGQIPQQLTELTSLSFFNVADNNLSGIIPQIKQFATFENDSYAGNPLLCGPPLSKQCLSDENKTQVESEISYSNEDDFERIFFLSFEASFFVAFVGVIACLYFNSNYWREDCIPSFSCFSCVRWEKGARIHGFV